MNDLIVGVEMITKKNVIRRNSTKQIPRVYQQIILFLLLGKNGIKEPVYVGKKTFGYLDQYLSKWVGDVSGSFLFCRDV